MAVIEASAGNVFSLGQVASSNIKILNVTSSLALSDSPASTPSARSVASPIIFGHTARYTFGLHSVSVASTLNFTQYTHPKSKSLVANNYLALTQAAAHPLYGEAVSVLSLSQVLDAARAIGNPQTITFGQVATGNLVRGVTLEHSLDLASLVAYYLVKRSFYVTSTPIPNPPVQNFVYFQQGSTSIAFPRPEPGNVLRFDFSRINRRSRGGDLILFRDEQWPKTKTHTLTFNWLSEIQKQQLLTFMQNTIGQIVVYVDHYGYTWDGFIMTPAAQFTQESLNNKSVTLDFQGVRR
jgi:hypothetical protein